MRLIVLVLLVIAFFLLNLAWGTVAVPISDILQSIAGQPTNVVSETIILNFRLPNTLLAVLAGASLSVSGLLMQTFFRNPIAGPYVLGVSAGASLGVALVVLALPGTMLYLGAWGIIGGAMLGATAILLLLLMVVWRIQDSATLLVLGLMLGSATSAVIELLQYFSNEQQLQRYVFWTMGSLQGATWSELHVLLPVVAATLLLTLLIAKPLDALLLGEDYARTLGVPIDKIRILIIVYTAILAGSVTAFCGPIAFVGIAVPHFARWIFQTSSHFVLILATALLGMLILLVCQWLAHLPLREQVLPINAVTSLLGAPLVVWIVVRTRK